jgi:hypothetical protein
MLGHFRGMAAPDGLPHVMDINIIDTEALREEVFHSKEDCLTLIRRFVLIKGFSLEFSSSSEMRYFRVHCYRGLKTNVPPRPDGTFDPLGRYPYFYRFASNKQGRL